MTFKYSFNKTAVIIPENLKFKTVDKRVVTKEGNSNVSIKSKIKAYFESYRIEYADVGVKAELEIPTYATLRNDMLEQLQQYVISTFEDIALEDDPKSDLLIKRIREKLSDIDSNPVSDFDKFMQLLDLLSDPANSEAMSRFEPLLNLIDTIRNPSLIAPCLEFNGGWLPDSFPARVKIGNKIVEGVDPQLVKEAWQKCTEHQKNQYSAALSSDKFQGENISLSLAKLYEKRKPIKISYTRTVYDDEGSYETEYSHESYRSSAYDWFKLAFKKKDLEAIQYFAPKCQSNYWAFKENLFKLDITNETDKKIASFIFSWIYCWQGKYATLKSKYDSLTSESDNCLTKIKKIFLNYYQPKFGLFLTLHWDRHHCEAMTQLTEKLSTLANDQLHEAKTIILDQMLKLTGTTFNANGSFFNRMSYAVMLIDEELQKSLDNNLSQNYDNNEPVAIAKTI